MNVMPDETATAHGAPINQAPPEVLGLLLLLSVDQNSASIDHYRRATTLESVCKHWYMVIGNTPGFWRYVNPDYPSGIVDKILSKGFPLSVVRSFGVPSPDSHSNLKSILAAHSRWVTFDIPNQVLDEEMSGQLEACGLVPWLETFRLRASRLGAETSLDLFGGKAPRLRELDLGGCAVKWGSGLLKNLRSLSLFDIHQFGPTKQELVQVLSQNRGLETLQLSYIQFHGTDIAEVIDPVVLPNVTSLELQARLVAELESLLAVVRAPACRAMNVGTGYDLEGNFQQILETTMAFSVDWCKMLMSEVRFANIHMGEDDGVIFEVSETAITTPLHSAPREDGQVPRRLYLTLIGPSEPEEVLSFVADMLSLASNDIQISLTCRAVFLDDARAEFLPIVANFPGVTSLSLEEDMELIYDYGEIGPKLARPIDIADGSQKWLFPQLQRLSYARGTLDAEPFAEVLRSRHNPLPGDPLPAPAHLETVELVEVVDTTDIEGFRNVVEDVIGQGNLTIQDYY